MTEEASNTQKQSTPAFNSSTPESLVTFLDGEPRLLDFEALVTRLGVSKEQRKSLEKTLGLLVEAGSLVETRDGRYGVPAKMNLIVGRLTCHEKGFGFVVPRDPSQADLYIPRRKLGNALHGDLVVARREAMQRGKTEGRIIRLLRRARTQVVGKF